MVYNFILRCNKLDRNMGMPFEIQTVENSFDVSISKNKMIQTGLWNGFDSFLFRRK